MDVINNHKKLYLDKYSIEMSALCEAVYNNILDRSPTEKEKKAFLVGHLLAKQKIDNVEEYYGRN